MPETFWGWVVMSLVVGAIAGACGYVIAYASYQNQFMDSRTAPRLALRTAGTTFLFFFVACLALPWVFSALQRLGS